MKNIVIGISLMFFVGLSYGAEKLSTEKDIIKSWNDKIFNMHDPLLYNGFFSEIQKTAKLEKHKKHQIIQLYSSLSKVFQSLEGITWREEPFLAQSDFVYGMWVSWMRGMYAPDYQTSKHMRKFGRYLTEPNMSKDRFYKISDLQEYLLKEVIPALENLSDKLKKIAQDKDVEFIADQYVYRGYIPAQHTDDKKEWFFVEERDRYQTVLSGHFGLFQSYVDRAIGALYFFSAYNFDGIHRLVDALVMKSTKSAILKKILFKDFPSPLAIVDRIEELKKSKYSKLLTQRNKNSQKYLDKALSKWSEAAFQERLSYNEVLGQVKPNVNYIFDTSSLLVKKERKLEEFNQRAKIYRAAVEKKEFVFYAPSTRYKFKIFPHKLFEIRDFKKLLAKEYFEGKEQVRNWKVNDKIAIHPIIKKRVYAWDFNYGKPITYLDPTFNGFLPEGNDKNYLQFIKSLRMTNATKDLVKILPVH